VTGEVVATLVVFSMIILAGVSLMIAAMFNRRGLREMEHRERLAMIERGLMPSPESDPGGFESAAGFKSSAESPAGVRYRTAGVLMIGFGLALLMLITFSAGDASAGFGVGGGFAFLGAASLLNYFLISRREQPRSNLRWTPPARRPDPPTNVAS
jgi:predicted cobalt transporter CbtA